MFRYILGLYFWFISGFITILFCTLNGVIFYSLKLWGIKDPSHLVHRNSVNWAKTIFYLIPGWKIEVHGKENLPKNKEACVFVSNHESNVDILALYFLGSQFRWLAKQEVFDIPLVGNTMGWAGYIPVKRGNRSSHSQALKESEGLLKNGVPMLFFPEGTRSKDGTVQPFKSGAFRVAQNCDVPVIPIRISGAHRLLEKGSIFPSPATVKVHILKEEKIRANENIDEYAERIRQVIIEHII